MHLQEHGSSMGHFYRSRLSGSFGHELALLRLLLFGGHPKPADDGQLHHCCRVLLLEFKGSSFDCGYASVTVRHDLAVLDYLSDFICCLQPLLACALLCTVAWLGERELASLQIVQVGICWRLWSRYDALQCPRRLLEIAVV